MTIGKQLVWQGISTLAFFQVSETFFIEIRKLVAAVERKAGMWGAVFWRFR